MAENRRILILSVIILVIVLSSCNAYQLYRNPSGPLRPIKYHILTDPDQYSGRMKQYHNNVAQLRLWRRYTDEFNIDDDDILQDILRQYKSSGYYKR